MRSKISITLAAQKVPGNCFHIDTLGVEFDCGVELVKRCSFVVGDLPGGISPLILRRSHSIMPLAFHPQFFQLCSIAMNAQIQTEQVEFRNESGQKLSGRLELPPGNDPAAFALFAHCFTCSKDYRSAVYTSRALAEYGYAVLRFDFTGLGESEGDFADTSFFSNVDDLVAAAGFLGKKYQAPKLLIGHSLGGAAVLHAAGKIPASKAVATIAAPCSPKNLGRFADGRQEELNKTGAIDVSIAGRPFKIGKQFFDALETTNMDKTIAGLGRALLVLHSPADRVVGIDNAAHIFEKAGHPKSFVSLDGADHLLSKSEDARYAGEVIGAWAEKYISSE
jgi:putative redox protein